MGGARLEVALERWPIAGTFTISRGSRTEAVVVVATIRCGDVVGRGECVPYARYGETAEGVRDLVAAQAGAVADGLDRDALQATLPAGAARNALDCALWDLEAKRAGATVHERLGLSAPVPTVTAFTISLGTPDAMGAAAARAADRPLLKVKLGGAGDDARIRAVRAAAPRARLVVDANEAWPVEHYAELSQACADAGVELIEQPFPAGQDASLRDLPRPVPVCADESVHDTASLAGIAGRYDAINIKLDKTGGLSEALRLHDAARAAGLRIMIGCMVGTSLSMAPAFLLSGRADWTDLDGPLILSRDRDGGLRYDEATVGPARPGFWGG